MKTTTPITVRVQAGGGMFLGPDSFGGAIISIKNLKTGELLAEGFTNSGNSGFRSPTHYCNASPYPIITPTLPDPTMLWLLASEQTVNFSAPLQIDKPTLVEIAARIPLPPEQGDQYTSVTQWILPNSDLTGGGGFILEIPGLWVLPEIVINQKEIRVRARVTMMCGCEVNVDSPWIPTDFLVTAEVKSLGNSKEKFHQTLSFTFQEHSQFTSGVTVPKKGNYLVEIHAVQISTGNIGFASEKISVNLNPSDSLNSEIKRN